MLATPGPVPSGPDWSYEGKYDGARAIVYAAGGQVRIRSRTDHDLTSHFPELSELLGALLRDQVATVDGEVVVFDRQGVPEFGLLQRRLHRPNPTARLLADLPTAFYAFDLLHMGRVLVDEPYERRRAMLEGLGLAGRYVVTPPAFAGPGLDVLAAAEEAGLEGVVAKRRTSRYRPGTRSRDWIKTVLRSTVDAVVGGWQHGTGRRSGTVGSLLLGAYDDAGSLRYIGHVGTGMTNAELQTLHRMLEPLARPDPPFDEPVPGEFARRAQWVAPVLVGEVAFRTWTPMPRRRLRHPSWRGLRDADPHGVRLHQPET
ncbi:MAG: bifunctional non-ous end joining protein LigD [Micromonosporaceae bacterium]